MGSVVGIEPLDEAGVIVTVGVEQVVCHDAAQLKSLAQLEAEHEVANLAGCDALGVFLRRKFVGVVFVVPESPAGEDAAQIVG